MSDGVCDDGGPGSEYDACPYGSDCIDCDVRLTPSPPPSVPPSPASPLPTAWQIASPSSPPFPPPRPPAPPAEPPPPPALEIESMGVFVGDASTSAACVLEGGCNFSYSLAVTPLLVSTSPLSGQEGDTLTVKGHALSLVPSENFVSAGGEQCVVFAAQVDSSFTSPACPVTSCTQEMQTLIELQCRLPHLDSFAPHAVSVSVANKGSSPALAGATITYAPVLRALSVDRGSVAGGTLLTLQGDGFSSSKGDVDVIIGSGSRCKVYSTNVSHITCMTRAAPAIEVGLSLSATVTLSVRGVGAGCMAASCTFLYDYAHTSIVTGAQILSRSSTTYVMSITGTNVGISGAAVLIGGSTPCVLQTIVSMEQITCMSVPPPAGSHAVTLSNDWGSALGMPRWPQVTGTDLTATGLSPITTGLHGGVELAVSGFGFSSTDTRVRICETDCQVVSVTASEVRCTAPSLLLDAAGLAQLNMSNASSAETILMHQASPPPPGADVVTHEGAYSLASSAPTDGNRTTLLIKEDRLAVLQFHGLNDTNLPRGSDLQRVALHVAPHSGGDGSVTVAVRAKLYCGDDGPVPLSYEEALSFNESNTTVAWDMQPYPQSGYENSLREDASPDLSGLLKEAFRARTSVEGCSLVILLHAQPVVSLSGDANIQATKALGWRAFHTAVPDPNQAPELRILYQPATTQAQATWTPDRSCPVVVEVPSSINAESANCSGSENSAASQRLEDTNPCAHLRLEATAATLAHYGSIPPPSPPDYSGKPPSPPPQVASPPPLVLEEDKFTADDGYNQFRWLINDAVGCSMSVNGVNLMGTCGLDRIVVGRDGVCAAVVDSTNPPRAACFDTKVAGAGIEDLASWIDGLQEGVSAMVVSCSRLSFPHNRDRLATALQKLGALDPPSRIDDAYSLIGTKGGVRPLAEHRTPCCVNFATATNGDSTEMCAVCDQARTSVDAVAACGGSLDNTILPSALPTTPVGGWASSSHIEAIGALGGGSEDGFAVAGSGGATDMNAVISTLGADDVEPLDQACRTSLTGSGAEPARHGALLATDGDPKTFWLSVGRPDAVITVDLGATRFIRALHFAWRYPAMSFIVLASTSAVGTDWDVVAEVNQSLVRPELVSQPTCSGDCEAEFLKCTPVAGYGVCRDEVDIADFVAPNSAQILKTVCVPYCVNTAPMELENPMRFTSSPSPPPFFLPMVVRTVSLRSESAINGTVGVLARRLRMYLADPAVNLTFGISELQAESCKTPWVQASAPAQLSYARSVTPTVSSSSPHRGSTAGGTTVTILVDDWPSNVALADVTVNVVGISCVVTYAAEGEVRCITGSYGKTTKENPGLGSVDLIIASLGRAVTTAEVYYEYIDLWSRKTTWGGSDLHIPGTNLDNELDSVWIQPGQVSSTPAPILNPTHAHNLPQYRQLLCAAHFA